MIYYAYWRANGNTELIKAYTGTNKLQLIRDVIAIANGNRFQGSTCEWLVWDSDLYLIDGGYTLSDGKRYRYKSSTLPLLAQNYGLKSK